MLEIGLIFKFFASIQKFQIMTTPDTDVEVNEVPLHTYIHMYICMFIQTI